MNTGETFGTIGDVKNRTLVPWTDGATVLQVDLDQDSVFAGSRESVNPKYPALSGGLAVMDFNWTWRTEYQACLLYTSPSPRDVEESRMPSSA